MEEPTSIEENKNEQPEVKASELFSNVYYHLKLPSLVIKHIKIKVIKTSVHKRIFIRVEKLKK